MNSVKYTVCSRCVMDHNDDPNIIFTENGVCSYCLAYEKMHDSINIQGGSKEEKLARCINKIKKDGKGKQYDCILGISGGVDSTYLALITKEFGLRPLAVHMDNGWNSELAVKNIKNIVRALDFDLCTLVIKWEEFRDLQLSYLYASVVDIEAVTDHAINASLCKLALKHQIKYMLNGANYATEGFLPNHWRYEKNDLRNLKAIYKKYGKLKLNTYPTLGIISFFYYKQFHKIQWVHLLDYVEYRKASATKRIEEELDWRGYEMKHSESVFTRFYQGYILPNKFGIDKRKSHYSTLICSGQMTREEALLKIQQDHYDPKQMEEDLNFVIKKLGLSRNEFDKIMQAPVKKHTDYPHMFNIRAALSPLKPIYKFIFK